MRHATITIEQAKMMKKNLNSQGIGVWSTEVCWLHRYLLDHYEGQ